MVRRTDLPRSARSQAWTGTPINTAPDEHDAIAWFQAGQLADLRLAHDSYLTTFTRALTERRD